MRGPPSSPQRVPQQNRSVTSPGSTTGHSSTVWSVPTCRRAGGDGQPHLVDQAERVDIGASENGLSHVQVFPMRSVRTHQRRTSTPFSAPTRDPKRDPGMRSADQVQSLRVACVRYWCRKWARFILGCGHDGSLGCQLRCSKESRDGHVQLVPRSVPTPPRTTLMGATLGMGGVSKPLG